MEKDDCKTCNGLGRLDAVYVTCPECHPSEEVASLKSDVARLENELRKERSRMTWLQDFAKSIEGPDGEQMRGNLSDAIDRFVREQN
jgi:hypothetical protein